MATGNAGRKQEDHVPQDLARREPGRDRCHTQAKPRPLAFHYGTRVRWKAESEMRKWAGDVVGEIVPQPIGSISVPPDGGVYVLWSKLKDPMACFIDDLDVVA